MIPPTRWRDDPSAPPSVREALRAGSRSRPLPSDSRQRSASRLHRLVFLPAAAGLVFWIKSAAIASLCVVGTVTVVRLAAESSRHDAAPQSLARQTQRAPVPGRRPNGQPTVRAPLPDEGLGTTPSIASAPAARWPMAPPEAALSPVPSAFTEMASKRFTQAGHAQSSDSREPAPASHEVAADPISGDPLAIEAAMLEEARAMLDGNARGTLAELDRYAARFPNGQLTIEGELLAVDALRRLGRGAEARARGIALLDRARDSLYKQRIRSLIAQ
jgi:hypothetical protein